jgi:hypothetical protein
VTAILMVTCAFVAGTLYEAHDWLRLGVVCVIGWILWELRGALDVVQGVRSELEQKR